MELAGWQEDTVKRIRSRAPAWVNIKRSSGHRTQRDLSRRVRGDLRRRQSRRLRPGPSHPFCRDRDLYPPGPEGQEHLRRLARAERKGRREAGGRRPPWL
jgi:hypothetical protein